MRFRSAQTMKKSEIGKHELANRPTCQQQERKET